MLPTSCTTQFRAAQACALAGKHLITNAEWQRAAAGTPDPGSADNGVSTCNTNSAGPDNTGDRTACVSVWGAYDMVGNVAEWVSDWTDRATGSTDWSTSAGITDGDESYFGGNAGSAIYHLPGAPIRGGNWVSGTGAGVFAVHAAIDPSTPSTGVGFRCAR